MKDLIFIDIVVEHMQKLHKEITCESKGFDIMSKIGNQFVLKAKTVNEIMVLSDLLKLLTGMTRTELTKEIRMREIQEMKEIDAYVNLKKEILNGIQNHPALKTIQNGFTEEDLIEENTNQFVVLAGEQDVVGVLKEFFKDMPKVHVADVSKKSWIQEQEEKHDEIFGKPIIIGTSRNIDGKTYFEKLWNSHPEENDLIKQMDSDLKIHSKIKEIIPVINDNFVLKQRLDNLKKTEQRLKKLPKSQRGELVQIQKQINTIKSWL